MSGCDSRYEQENSGEAGMSFQAHKSRGAYACKKARSNCLSLDNKSRCRPHPLGGTGKLDLLKPTSHLTASKHGWFDVLARGNGSSEKDLCCQPNVAIAGIGAEEAPGLCSSGNHPKLFVVAVPHQLSP